MQAFICFLISCNFGEIATVFLATLLGLPEPLTPLQLLWVNLVTDGPPATALGLNPPDPGAMSRPPRGRDAPILTRWLLARYAITGLCVSLSRLGRRERKGARARSLSLALRARRTRASRCVRPGTHPHTHVCVRMSF